MLQDLTQSVGDASMEWWHRWIATGYVSIRQRLSVCNQKNWIAMGDPPDGLCDFGHRAMLTAGRPVTSS